MAAPAILKVGGQTAKAVQPVIKYLVAGILLFVIYRLVKRGATSLGDTFVNLFGGNVQDVVDQTTPSDGTTVDGDFDAQAKSIADGQYAAMQGTGTDEDSLFTPLLSLNGAQLAKVYEKFGVKEGMNLFQWYGGELSNNMFTSLTYHNEASEGCTSWADDCHEKDFMRGIWQKSGLPITF